MAKIEEAVAEGLLQDLLDFYGAEGSAPAWDDSRRRLLNAIMDGRLSLDKENSVIQIGLVVPIRLENGDTIAEFACREPTANEMEALQKFKETENISKTITFISKMSGQPAGVVGRLKARDMQTVAAVAALFF